MDLTGWPRSQVNILRHTSSTRKVNHITTTQEDTMARMTTAQRATRNRKTVALVAFLTGAAVSISANVIAAEPTLLGRAVSVWPALALLVTVHLYQHVPVRRRDWVGFTHKVSVLAVIGIAAWVSYWHIVEVTLRAGETYTTAHIMPITIDAMMAVASAVYTAKAKPATPARKAPAKRATVTPLRSVAK
jgi:hypothetical protein